MAYLAIKKVGGQSYAYLQESYREGGKVRTRTVEYLGAIEPSVAKQVSSTRRQLGQADMAALVASVRTAAQTTIQKPDDVKTQPATPDGSAQASEMPLITTKSGASSDPSTARFLRWPDDLSGYSVNHTAMIKTQSRFCDRLRAMGVDPAMMPKVEITYGHPDGMRRNRDGSYTITASRKPQNKRHQLNKTKLWQHTRQALSLAYLDALANAQPEAHHQLQSELDESHKATKRMLVSQLASAAGPIEKLGLSLQLSVWNSVPQRLVKKQVAEEFGQVSFATLKDWRSEAAFVLAEAHKAGWSEMARRNTKARRKLRGAITRRRKEIDQMNMAQRLGARLSGKRRKLIREIMAAEAKLSTIDHLERRQRLLKQHFPL